MRDGLIGAIEAGGTKFICALARADGVIVARARIDTEVSFAFVAVQTTRSMLDRSKAIAVAAKTSRDVLERQYNAGSAPIVDFLDAQRVYAMAKSDELASLAAYRGALVELSRAVGEDLT